jgi:signal peptidase I
MEPNPTYITYTGPSMNPILKAGDLLEVVPYNGRQIRCGDAILFFCPEENRNVVHRVVALEAWGIRTMGDNNVYSDPWIVTPEQVVGYVARVQRSRRWRRIPGGYAGRLAAYLMRGLRYTSAPLSTVFRPLSPLTIGSRLGALLKRRFLATRIIAFKHPEGTELQLLVGRRVIGALPPGQSTWMIRRPFRLFVDETSLPTSKNGITTK